MENNKENPERVVLYEEELQNKPCTEDEALDVARCILLRHIDAFSELAK